jgi:hypothetical protein
MTRHALSRRLASSDDRNCDVDGDSCGHVCVWQNKGLFVKCRKLLHLLEDSAPQALQEANITLTKARPHRHAHLRSAHDKLRIAIKL